MKIKSLLLGSAAAVVAVSTANAADIIIPEPEMVEYVRVCDAAGTGFFYIPGTETCLRVHGYVRYDLGFGELNSVTSADGSETWNQRARASLRFSTWADTEFGPLTTYVETRWQWDTNGGRNEAYDGFGPDWTFGPNGYENDNEFSVNFAYIDLAGLRMGKSESFFTTFTGYGGSVINDTTAGGYGPFDTNLISYTFTGGAFSAGISLEQGNDNRFLDVTEGGVYDVHQGWGIDDYVPHIVAGVGYDGGVFNIRGVLGYDTRNDVISPQLGLLQQGGWTGKIRADVTFDPVSAFLMVMYGENSSAYTTWANGPVTADTLSIIGGGSIDFTDATSFNMQVQWAEGNGGVGDEWAVAANINHEIVDGFIVRPELVYYNNNAGNDAWGGTLRFQRSF